MYAQYAVSIKANRSSPRLLKNNGQRKMLLGREAFFYWGNGLPAIYGYGTIIGVFRRRRVQVNGFRGSPRGVPSLDYA